MRVTRVVSCWIIALVTVLALAACDVTSPQVDGDGSAEAATADEGARAPAGAADRDAQAPAAPHTATLTWSPPQLTDPETITVGVRPGVIKLDAGKDYVLRMPDRPVQQAMAITGGRNVVLIGGTIAIPHQGANPSINQRRGLVVKQQTGVVHIEGLLLTGDDISEGIQIASPRAVVQLQNVRVENLRARDQAAFSDNHPDVVQPWGGVQDLRVDGLTGQTDYQGMFLQAESARIGAVDLRRVNIDGAATARYLYWKQGDFDVSVDEAYAKPGRGRRLENTLWGDGSPWRNVRLGPPPNGDFVPAGTAGVDYTSPGYRAP